MANDERNRGGSRDRYRDGDDVRDPTPNELREESKPDTKSEARGPAREDVGNVARGTDAEPRADARGEDEFDRDLERDNRRRVSGEGMSELAREVRPGMADFPDPRDLGDDDAHAGWRSHARKGQMESPVERTHNEPPHKVQGHGHHDEKK